MQEILDNLLQWPTVLIVIVFGLYIVVYIPYLIMKTKKTKKDQAKFESDNKDVSKIHFKTKMGGIVSDALFVFSINGEEPKKFTSGTKGGIYAFAGPAKLEIQYTWTRPGVMYKNVTKTVGPTVVEVEVEKSKEYYLGFDRDKEEFTFEEK